MKLLITTDVLKFFKMLTDEKSSKCLVICVLHCVLGESGSSCNSFYSNPCSVMGVEYRKPLFISLGST